MPQTPQSAQSRYFPHISPDLYRTATGDAAQHLLGLAEKPLTFRQKYFGRNLDAGARAGRLLGLHKAALRSELAGEFSRADFFWRRFHTEFKRLTDQGEFWEETAQLLGDDAGELSVPARLRRRLTEEVFIETHLAFYRGYARDGAELPLDSRAFIHFGYVVELLPELSADGESLLGLVREPFQALVKALNAAGRWDDALQLCRLMQSYAPDSAVCQEEMAGVYIARNLASLNNGGAADSREDAKSLLATIERLEEIRAQQPDSITIFRLIGLLYHLRSIKLADAGLLSVALVDAQKAVSFCPDSEEAEQSRKELAELMKKTQAQMQDIEERMAKQGAKLNTRGQLLLAEVAKGFGPLDEFVRSKESREIRQTYLALKEKERDRPQPQEPSGEAASLPVHQKKTSRRSEPFGYWLFSREHLALKIRAAAAILLLVIAVGVWARQAWRRSTRDIAYHQMTEAAGRREYPAMIDAAESFLSNPPLSGEDGRKRQVINYYTDALLRLVIQYDGGELSPEATARLARYNQLVEETK